MRTFTTRSGLRLPVLGLGTWKMGEERARRSSEIDAIRRALDLGVTLIDTAEMYGEGAAEELIAEAIDGRRDKTLLVSKVYPWNATREGARRSLEASLRRLRTDRIDLYLLHWPGQVPLEETLAAFAELQGEGKLLHYGVSNVDLTLAQQAEQLSGGQGICCNQVLYNLEQRGIEWDHLDWHVSRGIAVMAYTPLASGSLGRSHQLEEIAKRHGATPAQVALAWTMHREGVVAIPKSGSVAHVEENVGALRIALTEGDLAALDRAFPPPRGPEPLGVI